MRPIYTNIPDRLKRLDAIEREILRLIPECDEAQEIRAYEAICMLLDTRAKLRKVQDDFIDSILKQLKDE